VHKIFLPDRCALIRVLLYNMFVLQATLGALRSAVQEATQVLNERQRLIFRGRVLSDDTKTLTALGLVDGNVLHMVERAPVTANAAPLAPHPDEQRGQQPRPIRNVIVGNLPIQRQEDFNEAHIRVCILH
jgi:hypothetical protein